jgi:hypothetical protein
LGVPEQPSRVPEQPSRVPEQPSRVPEQLSRILIMLYVAEDAFLSRQNGSKWLVSILCFVLFFLPEAERL